MLIRRFIVFLLALSSWYSLVAASVCGDTVHVSYDGRPIEFYRGEMIRYFTVVNESPFDEQIQVSVRNLVNISTNNAYILHHSAVEWIHPSPRDCLLPPYTRKHFIVEINPYPFLQLKEYYALIDVTTSHQTVTLPLTVRLAEPLSGEGESKKIDIEQTGRYEYLVSYRNTGEYAQTVDVALHTERAYPQDSLLVLPGEQFIKKYHVPASGKAFFLFTRDHQHLFRMDVR